MVGFILFYNALQFLSSIFAQYSKTELFWLLIFLSDYGIIITESLAEQVFGLCPFRAQTHGL
jgi:hypothetical protein